MKNTRKIQVGSQMNSFSYYNCQLSVSLLEYSILTPSKTRG